MAILAGLGALTGYKANTPAARTGTQSSTTGQSGKSSTRRALTPEQQMLMPKLSGYGTSLIDNPGAGLEPIRAGLKAGVNTRYAGAPQAIADKMLAFGGTGKSGKFGRAVRGSEMSRLGEQGGVDNSIAGMMLNRQDQGSQILQSLLGINFGQDTETSGTSTMNGTSMAPGDATAGALTGGTNAMLAQLSALMSLMQGGD